MTVSRYLNRQLIGLMLSLPVSVCGQEKDVLPEAIQAALIKKYDTEGTRYFSNSTDLNGDGNKKSLFTS